MLYLGFAPETSIATMKRKDEAKSEEIYRFRKEYKMVLATVIGKIQERHPLGSSLWQCITVFNPQELAQIDSSESPLGKNEETFTPSYKLETHFSHCCWQSGRPVLYVAI